MSVHPKRFLFSGGVCTFQLNAFSRTHIAKLNKKDKTLTNPTFTPETSFSLCKELCLSMQEVAITNALSYFLIYKLRALPRGDRYPNRFNSIFEFCQKMIQFNSISRKFNSKNYPIQYFSQKINSKNYSIQKISKKFNSKNYSIQKFSNKFNSKKYSIQKFSKKIQFNRKFNSINGEVLILV